MNKLDLNEKEQKVLDFVISQVKDTGYPPSVREICRAVGFKSTCSAHQYIQRLADKGYLEKSSLKMSS